MAVPIGLRVMGGLLVWKVRRARFSQYTCACTFGNCQLSAEEHTQFQAPIAEMNRTLWPTVFFLHLLLAPRDMILQQPFSSGMGKSLY